MNGVDFYLSMNLIHDQYLEEALGAMPIKRHKARRFLIRAAVIAAALILAFVAITNLFPATAYALSGIPVLGDLVKAVTFDPSMKACLSNAYAQYVGESQSVDGHHSEVFCMVVDAGRISVFFETDVPAYAEYEGDAYFSIDRITDNLGSELSYGCGIYETNTKNLYEFRIDLSEEEPVPDSFRFRIQYFTSMGYSKEVACAEYTLVPDKKHSIIVSSFEIDSSVTLMGQTIHIDRLDIFPTQSKLYFSTDDANTALLKDISITLYDELERPYAQRSNGVIGTISNNGNMLSKWYESPYFNNAKTLTATISAVSFLDKSAQFGTVDHANSKITNIPDGVFVASMILDDKGTLEIALKVPEDIACHVASVEYKDMIGNEYSSAYLRTPEYWSDYLGKVICEAETGYEYQVFSISNYKDNTYQVEWIYAPIVELIVPIEIPIVK